MFFQCDISSQCTATLVAQGAGGAQDQIVVTAQLGDVTVKRENTAVITLEVESVAVVDDLENSLQLVIAIGSATASTSRVMTAVFSRFTVTSPS